MTLATEPVIDAEIVLSFDEAKERTDQLVAYAETWRDAHNDLTTELITVYRDNVYVALNFEQSADGWNQYLKKFVGPALKGLEGTDFNAVVEGFTAAGMSTRAIAAATGKSKDTVARRQQAASVSDETVESEPRTVKGLDGKNRETGSAPKTFLCDKCGKRKTIDSVKEIRDGRYCEKCATEIDTGEEQPKPAPKKPRRVRISKAITDKQGSFIAKVNDQTLPFNFEVAQELSVDLQEIVEALRPKEEECIKDEREFDTVSILREALAPANLVTYSKYSTVNRAALVETLRAALDAIQE